MKRIVAIDAGAETLKVVELIENLGKYEVGRRVREHHHKDPLGALRRILSDFDFESIDLMAATGRLGRMFRLAQIPEKQARAAGFRFIYDDQPATIVSIGSHGFSVLELRDTQNEVLRENTRCSQGTGNFLMQLVERFGLSIEEASTLCEDVKNPAPLSGRCPVILKTDMTHLANAGQSHASIVAGLYDAVCENVQVLVKPALCPPRMVLTGGVMQSKRIREHFRRFCEKHDFELSLPEGDLGLFMDAIGCAYLAIDHAEPISDFESIFTLEHKKHIEHIKNISASLSQVKRLKAAKVIAASSRPKARLILGYDMGSTGSKIVAIDADNGDMLWDAYTNTRGNPIAAAQNLTQQFLDSDWSKNPVYVVGATGSGREIVGSLLSVSYGAERVYVLNEIAAHAEGAVSYDASVDTIFEIGGQDAKYIRIEDGRVVDAAMNEACSAGTGSFIEEQGKRFKGVETVQDLGQIALEAESACSLGQHCSVFMAEIIDEAVATGEDQAYIIAGIYDSIIQNYLNRVKGSRSVGKVIFCQGMPFSSDALAAAVARRTGSQVIVPPNPGTIGAQGIALLSKRYRMQGAESLAPLDMKRFLEASIVKKDSFVCQSTKGCGGAGNKCRIERIETLLEGKSGRFTWGGGCSLYDKGTGRVKLPDLAPDPFRERDALIERILAELPQNKGAKRVAISEEFTLKGLIPFYAAFIAHLGFELDVFTHATQAVLKRGIEECNIPFCAPMQLFHGVTSELIDRKPDILFQPMLLSTPTIDDEERSVLCPIVQAAPKLNYWDAKSSKTAESFNKIRFVSPVIDFQLGGLRTEAFYQNCREVAAEILDLSIDALPDSVLTAFEKARDLQEFYDETLLENGDKALAYCAERDIPAVVVLGRAYTIYNTVLNSNVPSILREQGSIAIPIDCLRVPDSVPLFKTIFWGYGQRNLRAAHTIRRMPKVYSIWCSNYACGPDSFTLHFYSYIMEGKPYAIIETDGHSGDAGTRTRVEAFLHCVREHGLKDAADVGKLNDFLSIETRNTSLDEAKQTGSTILIPRLGPAARGLAAALRGSGFKAEALSIPTRKTLDIGRKYTSGKECVPMTLTLGLLLERLENEPDPTRRFTFLMPLGRGPCRFGNYNHLHKITLERLGQGDRIEVLSPSDNNYFEGIPTGTVALAFCGIVTSDLLLAMRYDVRASETIKGETDRIYEAYADKLDLLIEEQAARDGSAARAAKEIATQGFYGCKKLLLQAAQDFRKIRKPGPRPTVLITGEIYVRCDPFANDFVIDKLQEQGIRIKLAPFYEWLEYQEYINTQVGIPQTWDTWFSAKLQLFILQSLYGVVAKALAWPKLTRAKDMLDEAEPYVRYQLEGEAGITVGSAIHEFKAGEIDGVLALGPHECMPSKVAEAQFFHVSEDIGLHSTTLHLNGDPVDPLIIDQFIYEVRDRFASRTQGEINDHEQANSAVGITKDFLKELVRGLPKRKVKLDV